MRPKHPTPEVTDEVVNERLRMDAVNVLRVKVLVVAGPAPHGQFHHEDTKAPRRSTPVLRAFLVHRTILLIPSLITATLKFMRSPNRNLVSFK